ncbi:MAG: Glycosyl transferase group 2 family protein [Rhodospirillaceae bacterium]|nr:MAG: Glycosyl transferase group 2 family protein [Rhodospirillaceae bacterium]
MLKATFDAVAALDYPDFEVLVILNNTPEEEYWRPVESHCARLGERFKFIFLPKVAGFKAGAMNAALPFMAKDAEIIAVIDADYVVHRDWLKDLVPHFADPKVGFIQAPQDHRDGGESLLKRMMKWEYDGFFDIGMVQRNEDNAIVAHGTMLLIRRAAFEQVGGWATDTIVEDSELGLRLLEAGYSAHYTNTRYGWGILPDTYKAFKTQRHRWAYGAVQIFRKHRLHMLPGMKTLSQDQKFHYLTGWFYWMSEAVGMVMAVLSLACVPVVLFVGLALPPVLTVPLVAAFIINVLHNFLLYHARVKAGVRDTVGAAIATMSLQLTIARAVYDGFITDNLPFRRTEKGGGAGKRNSTSAARAETVFGLLLLFSAGIIRIRNAHEELNLDLFSLTLLIQAIPFLAATVMRGIEKSQNFLLFRQPQGAVSVASGAAEGVALRG